MVFSFNKPCLKITHRDKRAVLQFLTLTCALIPKTCAFTSSSTGKTNPKWIDTSSHIPLNSPVFSTRLSPAFGQETQKDVTSPPQQQFHKPPISAYRTITLGAAHTTT